MSEYDKLASLEAAWKGLSAAQKRDEITIEDLEIIKGAVSLGIAPPPRRLGIPAFREEGVNDEPGTIPHYVTNLYRACESGWNRRVYDAKIARLQDEANSNQRASDYRPQREAHARKLRLQVAELDKFQGRIIFVISAMIQAFYAAIVAQKRVIEKEEAAFQAAQRAAEEKRIADEIERENEAGKAKRAAMAKLKDELQSAARANIILPELPQPKSHKLTRDALEERFQSSVKRFMEGNADYEPLDCDEAVHKTVRNLITRELANGYSDEELEVLEDALIGEAYDALWDKQADTSKAAELRARELVDDARKLRASNAARIQAAKQASAKAVEPKPTNGKGKDKVQESLADQIKRTVPNAPGGDA